MQAFTAKNEVDILKCSITLAPHFYRYSPNYQVFVHFETHLIKNLIFQKVSFYRSQKVATLRILYYFCRRKPATTFQTNNGNRGWQDKSFE